MKIHTGRYRPEIDGLRAIAVLAILAYHYWGGFFTGGYVGVDVFFVISGYLISGMIFDDLQNQQFSFRRFYVRRIRRIVPALTVMLIVSSCFAWMYLLPPDLSSFSGSLTTAALSVSNFYFYATTTYFGGAGLVRPLMHTWSLGVEEQFYLMFPVTFVVLHRFPQRFLRPAIVSLALVSFIWSVIEVKLNRDGAFYLPFSRAWEFLLGTILTLRIVPIPQSRLLREFIALAGIIAIGWSTLHLSMNTPFPGMYALVPCLATGAVILVSTDHDSVVKRLLSRPTLVFIGAMSYSLYLWHWPLVCFERIAVFDHLDVRPMGNHSILALIAFVLAYLSWKFVEVPFRSRSGKPEGKRLFILFGVTTASLVIGAMVLQSTGRLKTSSPAWLGGVAEYIDYPKQGEFRAAFGLGPCFLDYRVPIAQFDDHACLEEKTDRPNFLLFGDSHAANLKQGLSVVFPDVNFLQATSAACPPTPLPNSGVTIQCQQFVAEILNEFIPRKTIAGVVLVASWEFPVLDSLRTTIKRLHQEGLEVIVVGPFPVYDDSLPRLLVRGARAGNPNYAQSHFDTSRWSLDEQLSKLSNESSNVVYVSPLKLLCSSSRCVEYAAPGVPIEWDQAHLTLDGAVYLSRKIKASYPQLFASSK